MNNKKEFIVEIGIVSFVIILLFFSLTVNLQNSPELKQRKEKNIEIKQPTANYTVRPVTNAPMITITGEERADICNLAKAQAGVQEDGSPSDGYTPYHRWAANATQFGATYGTQWYTNYIYYEYWCVMFLNWCAYTAELDVWNNYPIKPISTWDAEASYTTMGRLSTNQSDPGLERGWISIHANHIRIYVGGGEWVDGNSYDTVYAPSRFWVSYNSRGFPDFWSYGKPYYRSKITYYKNDGSIANESNYTKYTEEKGMGSLPTPTKTGCNFGGWYKDSGFVDGPITSISSSERGLKKFYAKWSDAKRNIYYYKNGGDWDGTAGASTFQVDKGYTIPTNMKKGNGSVFVNWYNSTYTSVISSIAAGHNADVHVYARYKAPIDYNTKGGIFLSTPSYWYTEGVGLTLSTNLYRLGCTFDGWYYDANYTSKVPNNTIPTSRTGSVTVYAKWRATITFDSKIGAWSTAPTVRNATKTMTYYPGTSRSDPGISNGQSLYTAADLAYEGGWSYFAGWYTGSGINVGTGPLYKIGDVTPYGVWPWTGNVTLYARWVGYDYKVYLHTYRGALTNETWGGFAKSNTYEYSKTYTYRYDNNRIELPPSTLPTRRGHTFEGWYDNSSYYGSTYTATDRWSGGDKHYYAKWEPIWYPVTLYTYRGKVTDTTYRFTDIGEPGYWYKYDRMYLYNDDIGFKLPSQPGTIDRRGHDFRGWYKNDQYTGTMYTEIPAATIDAQEYYARWTPKIYELKLNKEGATVYNPRIDNGRVENDAIVGTYTYAKGSTFPVANSNMEKKGAIFAGWYDNKYHQGEFHLGIRSGDDDTAPIGNKEYWARWIKLIPDTTVSEASEIVDGELVTYIYQSSRIDFTGGGIVTRKYDASLKNKRKFGMKISLDSTTATNSRYVNIWLSSSDDPNDEDAKLDWPVKANSQIMAYNATGRYYTVKDNNTVVTYTCPDDLAEDYLNKVGGKRVYIHVRTETGNTAYMSVNLVRRVVYKQH